MKSDPLPLRGGERRRVIQREDRDALLRAGLVHGAQHRLGCGGRRQVVDVAQVPGARPPAANRLKARTGLHRQLHLHRYHSPVRVDQREVGPVKRRTIPPERPDLGGGE